MVAPALVAGGPLEHTVAHKGFTFSPTGQDGAAIARRARPRRRRARPVPPAAAAGGDGGRAAARRAARRGRLPQLRRAPVLGQPARDPRGARAPGASRSSTSGWCATAPARCPEGAGVLRKSSREYHEALATRALHRHQRPDARLVHARRRPGGACRRCTATRCAARASTSPRSAARRGGCSRGSTSRSRAGRTCSRRAGARRSSCAARSGVEDGLLETGLPRTDVLAAEGREARRAAVRAALGLPDERAGRALRADLPRRRGRPPRPLPARPPRRPRPAARRRRARRRRALPQAPVHLRHLAADGRADPRRLDPPGRHGAAARRPTC